MRRNFGLIFVFACLLGLALGLQAYVEHRVRVRRRYEQTLQRHETLLAEMQLRRGRPEVTPERVIRLGDGAGQWIDQGAVIQGRGGWLPEERLPPATPLLDVGREAVVINEILASNHRTDVDDTRETSDWVELYNRSNVDIDLAGCTLSNDAAEPGKWVFPELRIRAGGYARVWLTGKRRTLLRLDELDPERYRELRGPELVARDAEWRWFRGPARPDDIQSGRVVVYRRGDGGFGEVVVTQEEADSGGGEPGLPELGAAPYPLADFPADWYAPEFDDSVLPRGRAGFGYDDGDDVTTLPVNTRNVFLRAPFELEDFESLGQLVLEIDYDDGFVAYLNGTRVAGRNAPLDDPDFETIAETKHEAGRAELVDLARHMHLLRAGRNVLAIAGLNDEPSSDMSLAPSLVTLRAAGHADFRLPRKGGVIVFADPEGKVLDSLEYPEQRPDQSYGRAFGESGPTDRVGYFPRPSPLEPNTEVFEASVESRIEFHPPPGRYPGPVAVEIENHSSLPAVVRYTLDGTEPTARSPEPRGPVQVWWGDRVRCAVIRAAAFSGDTRISEVATGSWFTGDALPLPAMSIVMDPSEFAAVHADRYGRGRGSEREAHMELFEQSGVLAAATGFGLRLHGGAGRRGGTSTKKSYKAYFRKVYGGGRLLHRVMPDTELDAFDNLVLRAGYNDRFRNNSRSTYVRDRVIRDVHRDMGAPAAHGAWYTLFVNGALRGLYDITERLDDDFLNAYLPPAEGDTTEWDIIKTGDSVLRGTSHEWGSLRSFLRRTDFDDDKNYAKLAARVDLENFTAYILLNVWIQNHDWPHNNWYAARRRQEGAKWVFLSWDAEWGIGWKPSGYTADTFRFLAEKSQDYSNGFIGPLFAKLLENASYREFLESELDRHLSGGLEGDRVAAHIDRQAARIEAAIPLEIDATNSRYSLDRWRRNIMAMRDFARNRGELVRTHLEVLLDDPNAPGIELSPFPR